MTLQDLSTEAAAVQAALQTAINLAGTHLANVRSAKPALEMNTGFVTTARGATNTALQNVKVHLQNLNKRIADAAAAAPKIAADAEQLAEEVEKAKG